MNKNKILRIRTLFYTLIILGLVFFAVIAGMNYFSSQKNNFLKTADKILPFPAAVVNYATFLPIGALNENLDSSRRFYESQNFSTVGLRVDFNTEDGQKRLKIKERNILNKMIENAIIEKLANARGIKITDNLIAQEVTRKLVENGNQTDVKNNLKQLYGWDIAKFKEKVVKPEMYQEQLAENVLSQDTKFASAQNKINQAASDLAANQKFEDVVAKYSEGESAQTGGEMGWFSADQMLPEIALIAFQLEKGKTSDVIQSTLGFHLIQVEDKKTQDNVPLIRVRQIFVRTPSFADWLADQEKNFKVFIPLKDYRWNLQTQQVEFTDPTLQQFEDNLLENSSGDASIIF